MRIAQAGSSVIDQDEMPLLAWLGAMDELRIHADLLPSGRAGQQGEHQRKIIEVSCQALHPHHRNVDGRQRSDHAPVALVGDQGQCAGFGHAEVGAADAHVGGQEDFAQFLAGGVRANPL